ncbi:hypothetical protein ACVXG9_20315 [Escherichia coli]
MSRICAWCMRQAVIFPANRKADVSLILRNAKAMDSARNQVMLRSMIISQGWRLIS